MKYLLTSILVSCVCLSALAQSAIGSWQTHMAYTNTTQITQSNEKVYGISGGALYSILKTDHIIETYSKMYGLNDNGIHFIEYSHEQDVLFIAYDNSNIDLLSDDGSVVNIADLYRKSMNGSKKINDICFEKNMAYIACDFGIVTLDVDKLEFAETYIIGDNGDATQVLNVEILKDSIFALTTNNILTASLKSNLLNYQNWEKLQNPNAMTENRKMVIADNSLYLLKKDNTLYKYSNGEWKNYESNIKNISYNDGILFIANTDNQLSAIEGDDTEIVTKNGSFGIYDEKTNIIWYIANGEVYSYNRENNSRNGFVPNGPFSNTSWRLKYANGRIFSVPGGRWEANYCTPVSLSFYEDGMWHNYSTYYFVQHTETVKNCIDLVDIAINPNDKTNFWAASYGLGIYEFRNDQLYKFHHCGNSGLKPVILEDPYNYTRTDGMAFDSKGNLWILNNAGSLIKVIDSNGEYHNMNFNITASTPQDIVICNRNENQKFVLIPRHTKTNNSILFSFDDNGTLDNLYDDKSVSLKKVYDQDNKEINFYGENLLRCITQDKNGVVWIGTTSGIFLINNPKKVFDNDFKAHRIKIPRNDGTNLADYLLGTEEIKAIAVDGANRKWIGTASSGVYLISEDGLETIHHFTAENSPLLSNAIQSIAINEKTGEVFFGTGSGLISYQSDAIEGGNRFENVHAYPNPVRPEYSGVITITGLVADTQVRITDVNGNLVYETISNGGVATWDGCGISGERVTTGVYFAQCVSPNGKYKHITKILVVK